MHENKVNKYALLINNINDSIYDISLPTLQVGSQGISSGNDKTLNTITNPLQ